MDIEKGKLVKEKKRKSITTFLSPISDNREKFAEIFAFASLFVSFLYSSNSFVVSFRKTVSRPETKDSLGLSLTTASFSDRFHFCRKPDRSSG